MQESILAFRKRRYLWLALLLSALCLFAYWFDDPQEPANGGTALGYTLGVVATLLIGLLMWFGVRKRRYASTMGTLQGWLSAHVYLGMALLVIVLLHTGFQFGWNVHTLAFALLAAVIASGMFGVVIYLRYPERMSQNRDGANRGELLAQLEDIDRRSRNVAAKLPEAYQDFIDGCIRRTQLGETLWRRLRKIDTSKAALPNGKLIANTGQDAALDWLAEQQSLAADPVLATSISELSALIRNKRKLLKTLIEDLRLQAAIEIWLFLHVPLSAGLLVALAAHIVSVFLYW